MNTLQELPQMHKLPIRWDVYEDLRNTLRVGDFLGGSSGPMQLFKSYPYLPLY